MKKYLVLVAVLFLLGCTSGETKRTIEDTKERVDRTEEYLWENQIKEYAGGGKHEQNDSDRIVSVYYSSFSSRGNNNRRGRNRRKTGKGRSRAGLYERKSRFL